MQIVTGKAGVNPPSESSSPSRSSEGRGVVMHSILVVEDDKAEFRRYMELLDQTVHEVYGATSLAEALTILTKTYIDIVITDVHLSAAPTYEGLELLAEIQRNHPHILPIAMSVDPNLEIAEKTRRLGALEFLRKPLVNCDEIAIAISAALDRRRTRELAARDFHTPELRSSDVTHICAEGIVISPQHLRLAETVAKNREVPCVIYGETGTGKEEIAKLIHRKRCALEGPVPFVSVNCANLNSELADSLLFGHTKGSFSGADRTTVGLVGEADGGILFLDEVHTLSLKTQYKLLRVMNDGTFTRVGSSVMMHSHFQVIAASTRDLDEEVDRGQFLLDLRSRLIGIDVVLAPLRHRLKEMDAFVALFFAKLGVDLDAVEFGKLVEKCRCYYWRGNIRQLYKVLQSLVITAQCNDMPVRHQDLPEFKTMFAPEGEAELASLAGGPLSRQVGEAASAHNGLTHEVLKARERDLGPAAPPAAAPGGEESEGLRVLRHALQHDVPLREVMEAVERSVLEAVIRRHRKLQDAYRALRIGRNTFDVKRKKLGVHVDSRH